MSVLSGKEIREFFGAQTWKQGREYWQGGLVKDLMQTEGSWQGTVLDLSGTYRVRIRLAERPSRLTVPVRRAESPRRHAAALPLGVVGST